MPQQTSGGWREANAADRATPSSVIDLMDARRRVVGQIMACRRRRRRRAL